MTSMRRRYVASTSLRRHAPTRFLINQCQIITFLILKSDIIENSRIELRGIVLPVPSNQIKVAFIIIFPFNLVHLCFFPVSHRNRVFFLFHIEIEGKGGLIIGGAKGYVAPPPLSNYWGGLDPSSYAYVTLLFLLMRSFLQRLDATILHCSKYWKEHYIHFFISEVTYEKLHTVKILKFGTPQTIAIIVLEIETFNVTLH